MKDYQLQRHPFSHQHRPILQLNHEQQLYRNEEDATAKDDVNTQPLGFVPLRSPVPPQSFEHRNIQPQVYFPNYVPQPLPIPQFRPQFIPLENPLKTDSLTHYVASGPLPSTLQPLVTARTTTAMAMARTTPNNTYQYAHSSMQLATGPVQGLTCTLHSKYMEPCHYSSANTGARHYTQQLHNVPPQMSPFSSISQSSQLPFQAPPHLITESQSHLNIPPVLRPVYGYSRLEPESHQRSCLKPMILGQSQSVVAFGHSRGMVNSQSSLAPISTPILTVGRSEDSQLQEATTVTKESQTILNESKSRDGGVNRVERIRLFMK